jgi:hypothetical protein
MEPLRCGHAAINGVELLDGQFGLGQFTVVFGLIQLTVEGVGDRHGAAPFGL